MPRRLAIAATALIVAVAWPLAPASADPAGVPVDPAAREAEEAKARARLDQIRGEQRAIEAERATLDGERGRLLAALRDAELAASGLRGEVQAIEREIAGQADRLADLEREEADLERRLAGERAALAALVRALDIGGRHHEVRAMFAADTLEQLSPLLVYSRYLERARRARMDEIRGALAALADVEAAIATARAELDARRAALAERIAGLERANADRAEVLAALEGTLADQAARLAELRRDAAALDALLKRLTDAIADVPARLAGSESLASLRGRLPWPATGPVSRGADAGLPGPGLRIAASPGSPVRAVGHGRIAYADWMRGYGLLVIVDHGGGFMSLYANQRALLRQVGDWVEPGDPIAEAGDGGAGVPAGVYFELRRNSVAIDPSGWLVRR